MAKRKGYRIQKHLLPIGCPERIRNRKHLDWLSTLPCCRTFKEGPNDPAHISHENGKGTACKVGDDNAVPLNHFEHLRQHSMPEAEYWGDYLDRAKRLSKALYVITGQTGPATILIWEFYNETISP